MDNYPNKSLEKLFMLFLEFSKKKTKQNTKFPPHLYLFTDFFGFSNHFPWSKPTHHRHSIRSLPDIALLFEDM